VSIPFDELDDSIAERDKKSPGFGRLIDPIPMPTRQELDDLADQLGLQRDVRDADQYIRECAAARRVICNAAPPTSVETMIVDPETGGTKGQKLARFDLLPADVLTLLAEHYGRGARKYAERNWERGYNWSLSFAAAMRHAWAFWNGEDVDEETGTPHPVAAAWHFIALTAYLIREAGTDDRPIKSLDA
jgi:Domain of unknown function (DUF5664)